MSRALLFVVLGCVSTEFDPPKQGTTYECNSKMVCDGVFKQPPPAFGCAIDTHDAKTQYQDGMVAWYAQRGVSCTTVTFLGLECVELGERCFR